jgi:hypothetical protein
MSMHIRKTLRVLIAAPITLLFLISCGSSYQLRVEDGLIMLKSTTPLASADGSSAYVGALVDQANGAKDYLISLSYDGEVANAPLNGPGNTLAITIDGGTTQTLTMAEKFDAPENHKIVSPGRASELNFYSTTAEMLKAIAEAKSTVKIVMVGKLAATRLLMFTKNNRDDFTRFYKEQVAGK